MGFGQLAHESHERLRPTLALLGVLRHAVTVVLGFLERCGVTIGTGQKWLSGMMGVASGQVFSCRFG